MAIVGYQTNTQKTHKKTLFTHGGALSKYNGVRMHYLPLKLGRTIHGNNDTV